MNSLYGYAAALLIGASGAWFVQGLRWETDVQERDLVAAAAVRMNVDAVNQQLISSRAETEAIRKTFLDYKVGKENETTALELAVADGTKRLRVKASCSPTVPPAGAVPIGTGSGTAELDPSVRSDYFLLKKGLDRQFAELQFCRSE